MRRRVCLRGLVGAMGAALALPAFAEQRSLIPVDELDARASRYTVSVADKPVEDVIFDLEFAISEYNYRITGRNFIGRAIAEREPERPDNRTVRIIHFCNVEVAKQLLAAGEQYVLHMPCRSVVWEADGRVWVESRLLPEGDPAISELAGRINAMMRAVADAAIDW